MKSEILKRTMYGIAYGGITTLIALTILMIYQINPPISTIWLYTLMGFILGIYFGLASFIFEFEMWSPLKKTIIHFTSSIGCYLIIALSIGWVPFKIKAIIITTLVFIIVYAIFWLAYRTYYKRIEASLNKDLQKKN